MQQHGSRKVPRINLLIIEVWNSAQRSQYISKEEWFMPQTLAYIVWPVLKQWFMYAAIPRVELSVSRAQYPIELPGSLHTNKITVIFWHPFIDKKSTFWTVSDIFVLCRNTDFMWLFNSTHARQWRNDKRCKYTKSPAVMQLLTRSIFNVDFLENEIVRFDENLTVALSYDLQQLVMLPLPLKRLCANGTRKR